MTIEKKDELSNKTAFLASVVHIMGLAFTNEGSTPSAETTAEALLSVAMQLEEISEQITAAAI